MAETFELTDCVFADNYGPSIVDLQIKDALA